ncbi:MAG: primosomal protein N' [Candidatus Improbicoccus devescovinae]|nr:MAG: primosomal protein N' [Candidatus Improbicoccus devescovinae]
MGSDLGANLSFKMAKVAVEKTKFNFDLLYEYVIPVFLTDIIFVGCRVLVPFGRTNTRRIGVVVGISNIDTNCEHDFLRKYKNVLELLDAQPLVNLNFLKLAVWMSKMYFCTVYDAISVVASVSFKYKPKSCDVEKEQKRYKNVLKSVKFGDILLSEEQTIVYNNIASWYESANKKNMLLYGVTGSGKTFVVLKICELIIKKKQNVIFMVPEISLISQFYSIFKEKFGDCVSLFHSGLTLKQKYLEWMKIKSGNAQIVVGTRSAVFAPFENLGIIIIDEEHEITYKSEASPRFHAREIANFRCSVEGAKLILTSATPSVESFYFAKIKKYEFNVLKNRFGCAMLPKINLVNMNIVSKCDDDLFISEILIKNINKVLARKEQVILLLDRRGYRTLIKCLNCNQILMCKNCNISLNFHKDTEKLECHYCGSRYSLPEVCPYCNSNKICYMGVGTQKLEDEIQKLVPNARCVRVDADIISKQNSYEKIFKDFSQQKYDIMLGTRILAKGHNFKNVTLTGVVSADQSLFDLDFRSYERTFSLISQVTGRAGRGEKNGEALIQTYCAENTVISFALDQNYEKFYHNEISIRKSLLFPPFCDICLIGFIGKIDENTSSVCNFFCNLLKKHARKFFPDMPLRILNPTPAIVKKAYNKFRYKIIIKCKNDKNFRSFITQVLKKYYEKTSKYVSIFIDPNPVSAF